MFLAVTCLLALLTRHAISATSEAESKSVLTAVGSCPSDANLAMLKAEIDAKNVFDCAVKCASSADCSGMHFSQALSKCYLGNADQLLAFWNKLSTVTSDGCVSYVAPGIRESLLVARSESPPATTEAPSSIPGLSASTAAKLAILIDFRQGYTNLANPAKYAATPHGSVTRDSQGAHFPGSNSDFIEIDTDGYNLAPTYLGRTNNFTFFVKLVRQTWNQQNYHLFHDCNGNPTAEFSDRDSKLFVSHSFPEESILLNKTETIQSTMNLLTVDNTPQNVTAAAVFSGIKFSAFYFNDSSVSASEDLNHAYQDDLKCLRLGYNPPSSAALKGRYVCYAVAKAALSPAEIVELGQYCGN